MDWQNLEQIREAIRLTNNVSPSAFLKPSERWGHVAVAVDKAMFIVGGYHGKSNSSLISLGSYLDDVWRFNLASLEFTQMKTVGVDATLLARSNHTAIYYEA